MIDFPSMMQWLQQCANCDGASSSYCSGCCTVYYCSRACQKKHWPEHRHICAFDVRLTYSDGTPAFDVIMYRAIWRVRHLRMQIAKETQVKRCNIKLVHLEYTLDNAEFLSQYVTAGACDLILAVQKSPNTSSIPSLVSSSDNDE